MSDPATRRFAAEFKSTPGTLSVTSTYIAWNPHEAGTMDRQQQNMNRVINMLASKAGKPKISLKLLFKEDKPAGGLLFTFTSPTTKEEDRKAVQDILIPFVSANRGNPSAPAAGPSTPSVTPGVGINGTGTPGTTPGTPLGVVGKGKRKAEDGDTPGAGTPTPMTEAQKVARKAENRLKMKVLSKNPNLKLLHRELVLGGQISEKEFWEGREALIEAESLAQSLKPGRPSRLLDDRFDLDPSKSKGASAAGGTGVGVKQKESGPMILNITKELTREIFEEFPVVQDAYAKSVPGISEAEFWTRYFTSRLWEQHRASVRTTTNDEVNRKKDDIFDQYLEEPDWDQAPRKDVEGNVNRFLDLAATQEDHGDVFRYDPRRNYASWEGKELAAPDKAVQRTLEQVVEAGTARQLQSSLSTTVLPEDLDIYNEIDLEDLHGPADTGTISLDVSENDVIPSRREDAGARGILPGKSHSELLELASRNSSSFRDFALDFSGVSLPNPVTPQDREVGLTPKQEVEAERFAAQRDGVVAAMVVVKELHYASNAQNAPSFPFPQDILDQMRSCHNAATEFLRQYWSAVLPTPSAALGSGTIAANAATKSTKALKMAGYLKLTEGKVNAVIQTAEIAGVDPARVRAALAPTMGAVNVVLEREKKRLASATNGSS